MNEHRSTDQAGNAPIDASHDADSGAGSWRTACRVDRIGYDRGCAVIFPDDAPGTPIAVFRLRSLADQAVDEWYAIDHIDPASRAPVMARGLVGSASTGLHDCPTVTSPLHKQRYDLTTGRCLDDERLSVATHAVRVRDALLEILVTVTAAQQPGNRAPPRSPA